MSHRAQQIVDAISAALTSNANLGAAVYSHRSLTLDETDFEVPAVSIQIGGDQPLDPNGYSNAAFIDSRLELRIVAVAQDARPDVIIQKLLDMRSQIHISMMADPNKQLGISNVVLAVRYSGTTEPIINLDGNRLAGALVSHWYVDYRMNVGDPT